MVLNEEPMMEAEDRPLGMKKEAMGEAIEAKGENSPGGTRGDVQGATEDVNMGEVASVVSPVTSLGRLGQGSTEGEAGDETGLGVVEP